MYIVRLRTLFETEILCKEIYFLESRLYDIIIPHNVRRRDLEREPQQHRRVHNHMDEHKIQTMLERRGWKRDVRWEKKAGEGME